MNTDISNAITAVFDAAGVDGWIHALDLQTGRELGIGSDEPVVAASVFKVPLLVELFRQVDAGLIDPLEQVQVGVAGRAPGPTGVSPMLDAATLSWRDLALSMMMVSDNAATDVIAAKLGLEKVNATMRALGLPGTALPRDCRGLFAQMAEDAGATQRSEFPTHPDATMLARLRALQAPVTNRTTPREICRLLAMIWKDEVASKDSCAHMRRILGAQVWPHRLASGFPEDSTKTAGKTGTLLTIRNEAGVVTLGDGRHYAVGVFTRARQYRQKHPAQDASIGKAARLAVDALDG